MRRTTPWWPSPTRSTSATSTPIQHSQRVARLAGEIAAAMGLAPREIDLIVAAARVHDLGKIATDNRVLFKQSSLTPDEWRVIEAHPVEGGELAGRFSMFRQGRLYIRHHHERWDGKGYPDGLAGDDIPLGARIIAVADSYDAMTSDRPIARRCRTRSRSSSCSVARAPSSIPRSSPPSRAEVARSRGAPRSARAES